VPDRKEAIADMSSLTEPSEDLARRVLGEVAWEDRMVGHALKASGTFTYSLMSLEQVTHFIGMSTFDVTPGELLVRGGDVTACYVRPEGLQEWIGTALDDPELSAAVAGLMAADDGSNSYPVYMQPITRLLRERMSQARAVLGIPEEEAVEAGELPVTDSLSAG